MYSRRLSEKSLIDNESDRGGWPVDRDYTAVGGCVPEIEGPSVACSGGLLRL